VDGDVLAVLALNEATFTPGQLRRLLGRYSEAGVRKVLMRLTEQGVVHGDRVGWAIQPTYAAVFGSSARGEMTSSSDLDLLPVRPDEASQTTWDEQGTELSRAVLGRGPAMTPDRSSTPTASWPTQRASGSSRTSPATA
jgi:hypothetical protein